MKQIIGDHSIVTKINVKDLENSLAWYTQKLDFKPNPKYRTKTWAQLITDIPNVEIGLNLDPKTGTAESVLTFVVSNIEAARNSLLKKGVQVGEIEHYADGVLFAPFNDPDGNKLGLRQNKM